MTIVYKHIIREWLKSFTISFCILFIIITLANLISEMLRDTAPFVDIVKNYVLVLPHWFGKVIPLSCMMATLFSLTSLKNKNELVAILSIGVSKLQIIRIIFFISLFFGVIQFLIAGHVEPYFKSLRKVWMQDQARHFRYDKEVSLKSRTLFSGTIWYIGKDYYCSFTAYDKKKSQLKEVSLYFYNKEFLQSKFLYAKTATYKGNSIWLFEEGQLIKDIDKNVFPKFETFDKKEIVLTEDAKYFSDIDSDITQLNFFNLFSYSNKLEKLKINVDNYKVILYEQLVSAILCIVFALMFIMPLENPNRRQESFAKNLLFVLVFTITFWVAHSSMLTFGKNSVLVPIFAVFFLPILCIMYIFYKRNRLKGSGPTA